MKKDLQDKTLTLEECQRELQYLKRGGNQRPPAQVGMDPQQRRKLISDMGYMIETFRHELLKLKSVIKKTTSTERSVSPLR